MKINLNDHFDMKELSDQQNTAQIREKLQDFFNQQGVKYFWNTRNTARIFICNEIDYAFLTLYLFSDMDRLQEQLVICIDKHTSERDIFVNFQYQCKKYFCPDFKEATSTPDNQDFPDIDIDYEVKNILYSESYDKIQSSAQLIKTDISRDFAREYMHFVTPLIRTIFDIDLYSAQWYLSKFLEKLHNYLCIDLFGMVLHDLTGYKRTISQTLYCIVYEDERSVNIHN